MRKKPEVVKPYTPIDEASLLTEPEIAYNVIDDRNMFLLINTVKKGVDYNMFLSIADKSPFDISEWCNYLHLSERTLHRYKKENKSFDPLYSEKILELTMLYKYGFNVFGNKEKFNVWLNAKSIAMGGIKPKDLLDTSFGISMVKNELTAIEHGVLA
ncbi:MAG TPA: antitoxin Xre/MbcA/ParS toxin-binding domain-containing protein [Flavipsychrobacter sp.]|nr:antitoxin Xre/MbcA/ParS toxin-binding domain-containing protein [Flavipsychrobacter sp.]